MLHFLLSLTLFFSLEPPSWLIEPKDTETLIGSGVMIDCMVKGSPIPQVSWRRAIKSSSRGFESVSQVDSPISASSSFEISLSSLASLFSSSSSTDQMTNAFGEQYHVIRNGPDYHVYENGSLQIAAASSDQIFLCSASNGIGPGISKVVRLSVNGMH